MTGRRDVAGVVAGGLAVLVLASTLATLFSVVLPSSVVSPGTSCMRKCEERDSRICSFTFAVHNYQTLSRACAECPSNRTQCGQPHCVPANGVRRLITVVNHQLPGPGIHVCEGDEIRVEVVNELPSEGVSLHWHGLNPSPYMDGVPGVTQHHVAPHQKFEYSITADRPGTHFWHSLSGFQSGDGVFGPLVVRRPRSLEPHVELYDHDLPEHVIMVHDWMLLPTLEKFTLHHHSGADHYPDDLLVNGRGRFEKDGKSTPDSRKASYAEFHLKKGERYRLRVVSAAFMNCPIAFSIARHRLLVIASDGQDIAPYNASSVLLFPGERWDVVVHADQPLASYWMELKGSLDCSDLTQRAVVRYYGRDARDLSPDDRAEEPVSDIYLHGGGKQVNPLSGVCSGSNTCLTDLQSLSPLPHHLADVATTHYLNFNLRYLDNPNYYHPLLYSIQDENEATRVPSPQINNLTFRAPPFPLLLTPAQPSQESLCNTQASPTHCHRDLCQCLHVIDVPLLQVVDIVLIDAGGVSNHGQSVHMHGNAFRVVGMGALPPSSSSESDSVLRSQVIALDEQGLLPRNLDTPLEKDTVMVPRGGYTIIRFRADNPGYWLLQSQILFHHTAGMSVVLKVGERSDFPAPPSNLPRCPS
ncbi:laccase-10-like isoform X3 [Hyalella azteca]|uniref:Laccase-10-like isoform X1 n=1 Tax=Hyalella azteca TaxID=294128 RepID=A0A8B7PD26_HYAAZ|nr:laccase-10-like isoform X2 [Hyalella azteca]XP_047738448.1 laccase-10-like isoform X1 [Hyalella azteca]XP_047738449.1 laccase-10-like isoform X3 [Hyalella azteca]